MSHNRDKEIDEQCARPVTQCGIFLRCFLVCKMEDYFQNLDFMYVTVLPACMSHGGAQMAEIISVGKLAYSSKQSGNFRMAGIWVPAEDAPTGLYCPHPIFHLLQPRWFCLGCHSAGMKGLSYGAGQGEG